LFLKSAIQLFCIAGSIQLDHFVVFFSATIYQPANNIGH